MPQVDIKYKRKEKMKTKKNKTKKSLQVKAIKEPQCNPGAKSNKHTLIKEKGKLTSEGKKRENTQTSTRYRRYGTALGNRKWI